LSPSEEVVGHFWPSTQKIFMKLNAYWRELIDIEKFGEGMPARPERHFIHAGRLQTKST
jgi:hypothetical protein